MQCVATLAVGTVGMQQELPRWFSTGYDGNEFSSETSSALVLALYVPLSSVSTVSTFSKRGFTILSRGSVWQVQWLGAKYPLKGLILEIGPFGLKICQGLPARIHQ